MILARQVYNILWTLIQYGTHFGSINFNILRHKDNQMVTTNTCNFLSFWHLGLEIGSFFRSCIFIWISRINETISRLESFPIVVQLFINIFQIFDWLFGRIKSSIKIVLNLLLFTIIVKRLWYEAISIATNNNMAHRI